MRKPAYCTVGLANARLPTAGASNWSSEVPDVEVTHSESHTDLARAAKSLLQQTRWRGIRANGIVCGTFWTDSFRASVPTKEAAAVAAQRNVLRRVAEAEEIVGTAL